MHFIGVTLAALLGSASLSSATCVPGNCGKVVNHSPWGGKWADLSGGPHLCHVYNWHNGNGGTSWSEKRVACRQSNLAAGATVGGYAQLIDVDAVTFHDRRWRIIWENGESHDFAAGVWAKFRGGETVTCKANVQVPECRVACDPLHVPGGCTA